MKRRYRAHDDHIPSVCALLSEAVNKFEALLLRGDFDDSDAAITRRFVGRAKAVLRGEPSPMGEHEEV